MSLQPARSTVFGLFVSGALTLAAVMVSPPGVGAAGKPPPAYLTLLMGRAQWVTTDGSCRPLPGAVPLDEVLKALRKRGRVASGAVVVNRSAEAQRLCIGHYSLMPSWEDLAVLRDQLGFTVVSAGMAHRLMTSLTPEQQRTESCGSLPALAAHGHSRAWALFAYGDNHYTADIQRNVVSTCFAYGRTYHGGRNARSAMGPPWFQSTSSISGGACNDPALACYGRATKKSRRYASPLRLASLMHVGADQWAVVQLYRFATGSRLTGPGLRWDCTAADWRQHWTSDPEMYCFEDYLYAVDRIGAGVVVTDPATVAAAWGRSMASGLSP